MKHSKRYVVLAVVLLLAAAWGWGFWRINRLFPPLKIIQTEPGETMRMYGWEITTGPLQVYSLPELCEQYPDIDTTVYEFRHDLSKYTVFVVPLTVRNTEEGQGSFPVTHFSISSGIWHNGLALDIFKGMNDYTYQETGESITYLIPFQIYHDPEYIPERIWKQVQQAHLSLEMVQYPELYRLMVN